MQLVRPVTLPRATTGTSPAFGPGGGEYFEAVLSGGFGGRGRGKSKIVFVKYIISRTVDKVTADSIAVERPF